VCTSLINDADVDGFIVQLPLPKLFLRKKLPKPFDPRKDVDGFSTKPGKNDYRRTGFCVGQPQGIMELIKRYQIDTRGKHV
jgi:methylenetetrahydrofolate dehydrogenase (NADP+)/methenyltetrahydrofolate cyclohydrolase